MSKAASDICSLLGFLFQLGAKVEAVIKSGSISIFSLPGFLGVFEAAGPALGVVKSLPADISSLSDSDLQAIRAYVQQQLPSVVADPVADGLINAGLSLGQEIFDFVESVKSAKNPPAAAVPAPAPAS
jgi:hypothetical protein